MFALVRSSDVSLVTGIFVPIVTGLILWNVYVNVLARRRRNTLLLDSTTSYTIAVCSSQQFVFTALKLMLEGLPSSATGAAARILEHEADGDYAAIIIDVEHPGKCVPTDVKNWVGVYFYSASAAVQLACDGDISLTRREGRFNAWPN